MGASLCKANQLLLQWDSISRVLKTTACEAFCSAQTRQLETCEPNHECSFRCSHLPKNGRKYYWRQAGLAGEKPEALGPNRPLAFTKSGCFQTPKHALPQPARHSVLCLSPAYCHGRKQKHSPDRVNALHCNYPFKSFIWPVRHAILQLTASLLEQQQLVINRHHAS